MSQNKKFEAYAMGVIEKYIPVLLLQMHTFELRFGVENPDSFMECVCNYPYLNAVIKYSKKSVEKWKKGEDLTPYIVHEMCHLITDPFWSKSLDRHVSRNDLREERERLTDYICNIVIKSKEKPNVR